MALYQQLPFFNPVLPFNCPIQGGLPEGMLITVSGRVLPEADEFAVDFNHGNDVALHFKHLYTEESGYVKQNTRKSSTWGNEEKTSQTLFPRGQLFALQILVTLSSYQITANGKPFSEFKHRMPFSDVDLVIVYGMVELNVVAFQYIAPHHSAPQGSYMVPYKSIIHGGVQPGKVIIIQGVISPQVLDNRMEIFLRYKMGIAFHYSSYFDKNMIVWNTYGDGKWGKEEKSELALFKTGEPIQVTICSSQLHYRVFINGKLTNIYNHRYMKLEEIDVLEVSGDVQLSFVQA